MTVIDSATYSTIGTVPLGKRPCGIHASPDRKTIYVALSGSPIAGLGVDESTLPLNRYAWPFAITEVGIGTTRCSGRR